MTKSHRTDAETAAMAILHLRELVQLVHQVAAVEEDYRPPARSESLSRAVHNARQLMCTLGFDRTPPAGCEADAIDTEPDDGLSPPGETTARTITMETPPVGSKVRIKQGVWITSTSQKIEAGLWVTDMGLKIVGLPLLTPSDLEGLRVLLEQSLFSTLKKEPGQ